MIEITVGYIVIRLLILSLCVILVWAGIKYYVLYGIIGSTLLALLMVSISIDFGIFNMIADIADSITNAPIWNYRIW